MENHASLTRSCSKYEHFSPNLSYIELNDTINKLIEELGDKVKKQIAVNQQNQLLSYKETMIEAQQQYRHLNSIRNQEVIRENVMHAKRQNQDIFKQFSQKSEDMNNLYMKLKHQLQKSIEYSHQIENEIKYINKQCKVALSKGEVLDQEIRERERLSMALQEQQRKGTVLSKVKSQDKLSFCSQTSMKNKENRLKMKIQFLKEYLEQLQYEQNALEKIYSKYDYKSCRSQQEKYKLVQSIFMNQEFKKYIYNVLMVENKVDKDKEGICVKKIIKKNRKKNE